MSDVVVMRGKIECKPIRPISLTHGGQASFAQGSRKLTVKGVGVVVSGMETGISFALGAVPSPLVPCPCVTPPPDNQPAPCSSTNAATSGISTRIRVDGQGVLLDTGGGQAVNAKDPGATWEVSEAGQNILRASS
jgi:hypothetical protein